MGIILTFDHLKTPEDHRCTLKCPHNGVQAVQQALSTWHQATRTALRARSLHLEILRLQ